MGVLHDDLSPLSEHIHLLFASSLNLIKENFLESSLAIKYSASEMS